jgi:Phospholipase_D-nuclease N-terminal
MTNSATTFLLAASPSGSPPWRVLAALAPVLVLAIAFDVYCVVDVVRSPSVRNLSKLGWILIIVLVSAPWGGLAYLFFGRDRSRRKIAPR